MAESKINVRVTQQDAARFHDVSVPVNDVIAASKKLDVIGRLVDAAKMQDVKGIISEIAACGDEGKRAPIEVPCDGVLRAANQIERMGLKVPPEVLNDLAVVLSPLIMPLVRNDDPDAGNCSFLADSR